MNKLRFWFLFAMIAFILLVGGILWVRSQLNSYYDQQRVINNECPDWLSNSSDARCQ